MAAIDFNTIFNSLNSNGTFKDNTPIKIGPNTNITSIVTALLPYIFTVSGLALLVYLIIGGISFMTAGSDPKQVETAKAKITSALIGFVIVFISYWIVQLVGIVFNIQPIQDIFGR
jgi:uncharacterized membrane protein